MKKIVESAKLWSGELGNMRYFYSLSVQKFGLRVLKWFFSRKILFWNIFKNYCGFHYFWTKIYSWAKFKGNWFSDPKRSGPVLGRLTLKFPRDFILNSVKSVLDKLLQDSIDSIQCWIKGKWLLLLMEKINNSLFRWAVWRSRRDNCREVLLPRSVFMVHYFLCQAKKRWLFF